MKKLFSVGLVTLASLWLTPGTSSAGHTFGLFTQASCWPFSCCGGCCGKCCSTICVKPYNAFSPTCSGTLYCDGFCPMGTPPGYGPPASALPPLGFGPMSTGGECCPDADSLPPAPGNAGAFDPQPPFNPTPAAQPTAMPGANSSRLYQNPVPYYGPMQVGYSYPTYNPGYYYTQPMAVPYYWNSSR